MKTLMLIIVVVIAGLFLLGSRSTVNKMVEHKSQVNEIVNSIN